MVARYASDRAQEQIRVLTAQLEWQTAAILLAERLEKARGGLKWRSRAESGIRGALTKANIDHTLALQ